MKLQSFKKMRRLGTLCKDMLTNIAGGTTDPEIDSVTWMELGNNMAPLTLVTNLATIWRHIKIYQIDFEKKRLTNSDIGIFEIKQCFLRMSSLI